MKYADGYLLLHILIFYSWIILCYISSFYLFHLINNLSRCRDFIII